MQNIVTRLQMKSQQSPSAHAFLFLADGLEETARIEYAELDLRARKIAAFLQKSNLCGQRILLLYPTSIDFIVSFMGCLYAGVIAVPVACPHPNEFNQAAQWLKTVAEDAEISGVFTPKTFVQNVTQCVTNENIFVLDPNEIEEHVENYQDVKLAEDTIAYLQYTSGSTSAPKAAIVRHENLTHSLLQTAKVWHYTKESITFAWAPHTHVYGLVCGLLVPLYHGTLSILMPPSVFIQHPMRWLAAISKYQVTHSGCPNFGYDLCVREISNDEVAQLNLQSWQVAINGGENVRHETLHAFSEKFSACHFQLKNFNSAFGMSEVTGAIAVGKFQKDPTEFNLSADNLKNHKVVITKSKTSGRRFVSNGRLLQGLSAIVVNPEINQLAKPNEIGEIWLSGKSVVSGYWRRPDETRALFQAKLADSDQTYFRTGDFGFIKNNELCLTGRLKEVIVVHGKKYYPLDLETTAGNALKNLPVHHRVIFNQEEKIIFVQEVKKHVTRLELQEIAAVIQHAITKQHGIKIDQVVLVKENTIPKTASGKLQRKLCQKQFAENQLQKIELDHPNLAEKFKSIVAGILNLDIAQINLHEPISTYGFDSISLIKLSNQLNETFQLNISPALLFEHPTLDHFYQQFLAEKNIPQHDVSQAQQKAVRADDIAIVGISGSFPEAENVEEFWQNLMNGKDAISEIPIERWDWQAFSGDPHTDENKTNIKWGGFLKNIAEFDAGFFNISPREAELTDPQQRLFLQAVWHAIEDAGYASTKFAREKTGLFVGVFNHDYAEILQKNAIADAFVTTGLTTSMLANRVSYLLNLQGPSEVIDTACSSSLVALHHAVRAIQQGDCEVAIVGGVNALLTPTTYISASKANMLSVDGRCKTFDKNANGYVRSEGVAAIILKPLRAAIDANDHIYGVVKGTAVNHGGHVNSLTAPNPNAQAELIVTACQRAQIPVESIQYIEAHGTGTALGDPIEINGLKKAFIQLAQTQKLPHYYCGVGSVKTHIGHLEAAAGIAGVIKVLLALQHDILPGNLHFNEINPYLDLHESPFYIAEKNTPWNKQNDLPRRAGVSSFGFGGTNAHVILEDFAQEKLLHANKPYLVAISAKTRVALQQRLTNLTDWLQRQTQLPNLAAMSYTLNAGRNHFTHRCVFIVHSSNELLSVLQGVTQQSLVDQVKDQKLTQIAQAYLAGDVIDWESVYSLDEKQRISLPTYPFARETYWVKTKNMSRAKSALHTLIDENISTLNTLSFRKEFNGKEFYLKDHHVQQEAILPGVISLEMARVAGELAYPEGRVTCLQEIIWIKPVAVQQATKVQLNLMQEAGGVNFALMSMDETVHAAGKIIYDLKNEDASPLDIAQIKNNLQHVVNPELFYAQFKEMGIQYGESFRPVTEIRHDTQAVLAKLQLPAHLVESNEFGLHPSLLDGALQTVFVLLRDRATLYLPFSIAQIDILQPLTSVCYVYATQAVTSDLTAMPMFNLQVTDEQGNVLIGIQDFSLCALPENTSPLVGEVTAQRWVRGSGAEKHPSPATFGVDLSHKGRGNPLAEDRVYYYRSEWVQQPLLHSSTVDENIFVLDEEQKNYQTIFPQAKIFFAAHEDQLLQQLMSKNLNPSYIVLPNCKTEKDFYLIVRLTQALIHLKANTQIICVNQTNSMYAEALTGFAKVLRLENPNISLRVISTSTLQSLANELPHHEIAVRYDQNNVRWIQQYQPIQHAREPEKVLRHQGVYLITGGMGGLGFIFARFLAEHYQATLILTGRSQLNSEQQAKIAELEKFGANVKYISADVANVNDLKKLMSDIKLDINGVIHAAGVLRDAYILKKSEKDISEVLAPKISGVLNLDKVIESESLDFFVLFSSAASILGNVGQSDYAYANAFMDAFAQQRSAKTISINWPLWAEGGAEVDATTQQWLQDTLGVRPLTTAEGIQAFLAALAQDDAQFIVFSGNQQQIEKSLSQPIQKPKSVTVTQEVTAETRQAIEGYLKQIIAKVIKLTPEKIKAHEAFEIYGIDSVMIILLNQALEKEFGELPKTLFFEYQSLAALADYFIEHHAENLMQKLSVNSRSLIKVLNQPAPKQKIKLVDVQAKNTDIAIIGISGRYPQADNLATFWENLKAGKDSITEMPKERLELTNNGYAWGGFISDVDKFDPLFFNISPREAELMDPQERLFLENAWHALEDAGYARESLEGQEVGVFVGVMYSQYQLLGAAAGVDQALPHSFISSIANRVSYFLDLHGPSIALDTMCSSSLTAIHLACKSIRDDECQLAIAGGVNLSFHPHKFQLLNGGKFLASDGRCRSFGEAGDGYVPGEGVGSIILKSLTQALADGDHIYAVIKGSSINHGGKTNGYTVPNPVAQTDVIAKAYQNAGVDPLTVSYLEAHGTGTALGDPIEIAGLSKVFQRAEPFLLGSVKSNIGHCESAAGIAAITKVILQMQHKKIVPSLHAEHLNPNIAWHTLPFKVATQLSDWQSSSSPRRSGISSFGAGGSNAHFILEEGPAMMQMAGETKPFYLISLSAKTETALKQKMHDLATWLTKQDNSSAHVLANISYTLNVGRSHFEKRCALVVDSLKDLQDKLLQLASNESSTNACINLNLTEKPQENAVLEKIMQQLQQTLMQFKQLSANDYRDNLLALAKFYVDGYALDWNMLHQDESQQKISLPVYPFARDRYWYSPDANITASATTLEQEVSVDDKFNHAQNMLKTKVSAILKIKSNDIDVKKNLSDYGMDSVGFIKLAEQINQAYNITLTPAVFYANTHINSLSQYLAEKIDVTTTLKTKKPTQSNSDEPIAIIGMQGMFPQANNITEFWQNLINGQDCITEVPSDRWNWRDYYGDSKLEANKTNSKWGGFINGVDLFDASFFNISAREANLMDPQHRLLLAVVWQAIEDAGYDPFTLGKNKVGLFAGVEFSEYQTLIAKQQQEFHGLIATGNSHSLLPNRISYFLNLQGPSEAIDTACSSSLVAIHRAVKAIRHGECELAIASGVSLALDPNTFVITSQLGALSPNGRCKTFDESANGYVKGEGVAAVILKPLSAAQRDGDHIYAVIKGSAVNHGGKAQSLTAPNSNAQTDLLVDAYSQTGFAIETVSYIEAHGTGTALGDPVEIEGLKQAFNLLSSERQEKPYCALGSVKTQIGHLEPASGIAGFIKVLLAMHHQMLPSNLHLNTLNPYISLVDSPFYLLKQKQSWTRLPNAIPRRAGVSSFGFGGTNAHVVVEEVDQSLARIQKSCYLITLSAKQEQSLKQKIIDLHAWLTANKDVNLTALSYTLNAGRAHFDWRCAVIFRSADELLSSLSKLINAESSESAFLANCRGVQSNGPVYDEIYRSSIASINGQLDDAQYRKQLYLLADLYLKNYSITWQDTFSAKERVKIPMLPSYPFAKQHHWFDLENPATKLQEFPINENQTADTIVIQYLQQVFAEKLRIAPEQIAVDETYETYGVDSVLGLEITQRLQHDFADLPQTILYEKNQLHNLASYLLRKYADKVQQLFKIETKAEKKPQAFSLTTPSRKTHTSQDIAIIGLNGTFPMAKNIEEFWQNLMTGKDCVGEVPSDRWNYLDYPVTVGGEVKYFKHGGFIEDIDKFDPLFFSISPRDAALMDPQERLFMQSVWSTFEDAGYTRERLQQTTNNQVGVFAGVTYNYYPMFIAEEWQKGNQVPMDIQTFSIANRISYFLNLNGPSLVIDTACSSSLAAMHLACESILRGECSMAIAGGVNLSLHPSKYHFLGSFSFMSDQGRCTSFAEGGSGYVPSEGVGAVLLKPLDQAIKDNDRIYGVIKGSSMNHGGKTSGYTVPNPNAQAALIQNTLEKAQIDPRTISYIEAHGTGTSLGDPIEVRGLQEAFEVFTQEKQFCAIGSVKSNIGHLESAAGISQLAKVLLQMREKKLAPSLHAEKLNSFIDFAQTPFYVQRELQEWQSDRYPRRAGISSFGAGGANVHIIVEEYSLQQNHETSEVGEQNIFLLSAMNAERLQVYARNILEFLQDNANRSQSWLNNFCYTSQVGREHFSARLAIVLTGYDDLLTKIQKYLAQPEQENSQIFVNHASQTSRNAVTNLAELIAQKQCEQLAQLWINGSKITWDQLHANKPQRIAMPTYPFAKRRCWVPTLTPEKSPQTIEQPKLAQIPEYVNEWLYSTRWEAKQNQAPIVEENSKNRWLIFSDKELGFILHDEVGGSNSILCFAGERYHKINEHTYYINPESLEDYQQLFSELANKFTGIIYLWSHITSPFVGEVTRELWVRGGGAEKHPSPATFGVDLSHKGRGNAISSAVGYHEYLLNLFQTLSQQKINQKMPFCLVSRGSQAIQANEPVNMWQHHLWSMTRIFAAEHANFKALMLDLDRHENLRIDAQTILHELQHYSLSENHVAVRNGERFTVRLAQEKIEDHSAWQVPDAALITGGLGALGIEVAKWLAAQGCKYLLLTGATSVPPRAEWDNIQDARLQEKIREMRALETLKVQVKYAAIDICDKQQMQDLITQAQTEWKTSIQGVFHLAGVTTDNMPFAKTDTALFRKVFAVKAQGALVLHELFQQTDLRCFVLFSSIAAVPYFGMSGLSAYAMANEFLNGLALARRQQGLAASSINWVAWAEKGMSHQYDHSHFLDAVGMASLSIAQGIEIMQCLLAMNPATITVCKINWDKFLLLNTEAKKIDFFKNFVKTQEKQIDSGKNWNANDIAATIKATLAKFLELDPSEIDADTPFQNYGMDSIIGINFVASLNQHFPDAISPMDLYRYPTLNQLIEFIQESCLPTQSQQAEESLPKTFIEEEFLKEINHLSDEQIAKLIEDELKDLEIDYE